MGQKKVSEHFVSKLTDAIGEELETQHWIEAAQDCAYLSPETSTGLLEKYDTLGKMLNSMINKSASFCAKSAAA